MKIGIDISQLAYKETGVSNYLKNLIDALLELDKDNEYILFFSSLRGSFKPLHPSSKVKIRRFFLPPTLLNLLWNRLHIFPIERLIGEVDVFITSDWTEPPTKKAKKATILYDIIVYKYPEETHNRTEFNPFKLIISPNIVSSQRKKLEWVKKESDVVFCISESTKQDAMEMLGIPEEKLKVIYPGI